MDLKKLEEILAAKGIPEDEVKEIIDEVKEDEDTSDSDEKVDEDDTTDSEDGKPADDVPPSTDETDGDEDDLPPGSHDGEPSESSVPPQDDADTTPSEEVLPPADELPPVPPSEELPLPPEGDVPPADVPPSDVPPEAPAPGVDPSAIADLVSKYEESQKTIEGLLARVDSLEQALAQAGVLDKSETVDAVGDDNPRSLENGSVDANDPFEEQLAQLNGKRRY